jgi:hypothetical protein
METRHEGNKSVDPLVVVDLPFAEISLHLFGKTLADPSNLLSLRIRIRRGSLVKQKAKGIAESLESSRRRRPIRSGKGELDPSQTVLDDLNRVLKLGKEVLYQSLFKIKEATKVASVGGWLE